MPTGSAPGTPIRLDRTSITLTLAAGGESGRVWGAVEAGPPGGQEQEVPRKGPTGPHCSFSGHSTGHGVTLTLSGLCGPFGPLVAPSTLGWRCPGRARRAEQRGRDAGAEDGDRERNQEAAPGLAQEGQSLLSRPCTCPERTPQGRREEVFFRDQRRKQAVIHLSG